MSSDAGTERCTSRRRIPFVSAERRPAPRRMEFHVSAFRPGRRAESTDVPDVRSRRPPAEAASPPSEHRTTIRGCAAQSHLSAHCADQAHLSRRRLRVPRRADRVPGGTWSVSERSWSAHCAPRPRVGLVGREDELGAAMRKDLAQPLQDHRCDNGRLKIQEDVRGRISSIWGARMPSARP
jgi:hypothetical protein